MLSLFLKLFKKRKIYYHCDFSSSHTIKGGWLKFYKSNLIEHDLSKSIDLNCSFIDCPNIAKVGAHIKRKKLFCVGSWYIVPACYKCNNHNNHHKKLYLKENIIPLKVAKKKYIFFKKILVGKIKNKIKYKNKKEKCLYKFCFLKT